jgi:arabinose-5-phosphate isomerase
MTSDLILTGRKAIAQEAHALQIFGQSLDATFEDACHLLLNCEGTVLLTGMGKSGLVARKWASTFLSTGTRAYFINPAEAPHGDLGILRDKDILVALSYSGETEELGAILRHASDSGIKTIGVTGNPASSLAKAADIVISVKLSEEACPLNLAPTTSTTVMMALGDALSITLMQKKGFTERDFARLHPGGSLGKRLWLKVSALMHSGGEIPRVDLNDTLERVLVEMTQKRLGCAVVEGHDLVHGIITDGDLRRFFQRNGRVGDSARAADLMTPSPRVISGDALAVEAREVMEKHAIHQLVVNSADGKLLGILHLDDLLRAKVI